MSKGLFGDMFDFNKDGEMGFIERAAELAFLNELLTEEEKELVYQLYFNHKSERQLALETGVSNVAVNKRKNKVLSKLKNYFEICG